MRTWAFIVTCSCLAARLWAASAPPSPDPAINLLESTSAPVTPIVLTTNANLFASMESLDNTYKLGRGDRLSYRVIEDKDDARPLMVSDSGELEIPYFGRVKAEGRTCKQLALEVKELVEKDLYYRATVIIAVDQLNPKRGTVYVYGQVRRQGAVPIPSDEEFTLTKAIMMAGGFGDFANQKKVSLRRKPLGGNTTESLVNVEDIIEKGRTERDIKLEPGDTIWVPSRAVNF